MTADPIGKLAVAFLKLRLALAIERGDDAAACRPRGMVDEALNGALAGARKPGKAGS
jgi:hypothetical protein